MPFSNESTKRVVEAIAVTVTAVEKGKSRKALKRRKYNKNDMMREAVEEWDQTK